MKIGLDIDFIYKGHLTEIGSLCELIHYTNSLGDDYIGVKTKTTQTSQTFLIFKVALLELNTFLNKEINIDTLILNGLDNFVSLVDISIKNQVYLNYEIIELTNYSKRYPQFQTTFFEGETTPYFDVFNKLIAVEVALANFLPH